jgi:2-(1,2-epoxy-1,2-dihydrophenyl)acetyl-CoA isomerase
MADTDYENFVVSERDGVRRVEIHSTSKMNALNRTMTEELVHIAVRAAEDPPRCLLLTGSDGVFCAGGDVKGFAGARSPAEGFRKGAGLFHEAVLHLHTAEVPIVVGVNGPAVGAGFGIALHADLAITHADAYYQFGYPRLGLTGDGGLTWALPRVVGTREAKRIALLNERIDATEALELGLTHEVADEDFEERLTALAARVAAGPSVALGKTARLLDESLGRDLPGQLAAETEAIAAAAGTEDHAEGLQAFAAKRDPEFEGR